MKTGFLITARLGSTRLSRKHLIPVDDRPVVAYLIDRIHKEFEREIDEGDAHIIIATGDNPLNRDFESVSHRCSVFYGSENNIPLRHLQALEYFKLDAAVSVDGDDILCSVDAMRKVSDALSGGRAFAKTSGLPLGMNAMGYRRDFLAESLDGMKDSALETGWGRIFKESEILDIPIASHDSEDLRFTLDYDLDFDFFEAVISGLKEKVFTIGDKELVEYVTDNEIYKINSSIAKEYWENFYNNVDSEKQSNHEE